MNKSLFIMITIVGILVMLVIPTSVNILPARAQCGVNRSCVAPGCDPTTTSCEEFREPLPSGTCRGTSGGGTSMGPGGCAGGPGRAAVVNPGTPGR
jgi:hypothetical protein